MFTPNSFRKIAYLIICILVLGQNNSFAQEAPINTKKSTKNEIQEMASIALIPFKTTYVVKKGQTLTYSYEEQPSVGKESDYTLKNEDVVSFLSRKGGKKEAEETKSDGPTIRVNSTGGGKVMITLTFEAIAVGTCELIIRDYYKTALKTEYSLNITVEE